MKNIYFILPILLGCSLLFSQGISEEQFNKAYDEISYKIAPQDPDKAIKMADSLFAVAIKDTHKFKSLAIKANAYAIKSHISKAIESFKMAIEIADKTNDYYWRAVLNLSIARIFVINGVLTDANYYTREAQKLLKLIPDVEKKLLVNVKLNDIKAELCYAKVPPDTDSALIYLYKIRFLYTNSQVDKEDRYNELGRYAIYIAESHLEKKNNDSAYFYYKQAKSYLSKVKYPDKRFLDMANVGLVAYKSGKVNNDSLQKNAESLLHIAEKTNNDYMKDAAYRALLKKENVTATEAKEFLDKSFRANANEFRIRSEFREQHLQEAKDSESKMSAFFKIMVAVALFLTGLYIFSIYRNRIRRKEDKIKYNLLLEKIREQKESVQMPDSEIVFEKEILEEEKGASIITENEHTYNLGITAETENKILSKLDAFERKSLFKNKHVSLSFIASEFSTNSRYISYVVNKHKNTDFKNYINTLRVNYIIEKLIEDEKYRKYKISTLAEESGFSSHSKFTTIFKAITGISPSVFIEFVEEDSLDNLEMINQTHIRKN